MFTKYLEINNTDEIEWYHWQLIQMQNEDNSTKRVTSCVQKLTPCDVFLEELEKDLDRYPSHIFRARWQHKQLQNTINNLQDNQVVLLMDFSDNYNCCFQNES